jgi:hypothetical protein
MLRGLDFVIQLKKFIIFQFESNHSSCTLNCGFMELKGNTTQRISKNLQNGFKIIFLDKSIISRAYYRLPLCSSHKAYAC